MADQQTNLHPKNNTTVDLKPNIVSNNIPDKAVTMEKLDQSLQDTISTHSSTIATNTEDITKNKADIKKNTADITKNTADIEKNTADITKNKSNVDNILDIVDIAYNQINPDTLKNSINGDDDVIVDVDVDESNEKLGIHLSPELQDTISTHTSTIATNTADIEKNTADITKNTEDITKNKADITNLETRTKNLEDSKIDVNTGTFDPTSDNPASQKSIMDAIIKSDLNTRFNKATSGNLTGAFCYLPNAYSGKFHLINHSVFKWGTVDKYSGLFYGSSVSEIDHSDGLNIILRESPSIEFDNVFTSCTLLKKITATYSLRNVSTLNNAFNNCVNLKIIKLKDFPVSFDISASSQFEESDLVEILNNLMDLTGKTSQTLTMGATNLAKLTDAEKAIATNKNWTLA